MDSAQFMAMYAKTSGLIDRLEALAVRAREAYAVRDKRMFHQWMGEYTPVWQQAQDGVTEIGESAVQNALSRNLQLDPNSVANMYEELTRRFVNHTNGMTAFMATAQRENPQFLVANTRTGSGGCYIATAVYGSYDAPEVWSCVNSVTRGSQTALGGGDPSGSTTGSVRRWPSWSSGPPRHSTGLSGVCLIQSSADCNRILVVLHRSSAPRGPWPRRQLSRVDAPLRRSRATEDHTAHSRPHDLMRVLIRRDRGGRLAAE